MFPDYPQKDTFYSYIYIYDVINGFNLDNNIILQYDKHDIQDFGVFFSSDSYFFEHIV